MKYLLKDIMDYMDENDNFKRRAQNYSRTMKTQELEFMQLAIEIIKGIMLKDMLSFKHTNLDAYEKDVAQRTYYNIHEILDFLSNPEQWFRKKSKLRLAYSNTTEKIKRQFKRGGTK